MEFGQSYEDDIFYNQYGLRHWQMRHAKVTEILDKLGSKRVCDLGCSEGQLIRRMSMDDRYELIVGVDIDEQALTQAKSNSSPLLYHRAAPNIQNVPLEIHIFKGDILKDCSQLQRFNFDTITLIEVLEHVQYEQLEPLFLNILGIISPQNVIATTPNFEFNEWFENEDPDKLRHYDHKFELTQQEFVDLCEPLASNYGYKVEFDGVGEHKKYKIQKGYCSQIAVFTKINTNNHAFNVVTSFSENNKLEDQQLELFEKVIYPSQKPKSNYEILLELLRQTLHNWYEQSYEGLLNEPMPLDQVKNSSLISNFLSDKPQNLWGQFINDLSQKEDDEFIFDDQNTTVGMNQIQAYDESEDYQNEYL